MIAGPCLMMLLALGCGEKAKEARKVRVFFVVTIATEKGDKIDDKLKDIATEVQRMRPALKGFKLASISCKSLAIDAADLFDVIDEQKAKIVIEKAADKAGRVQLRVKPPKMGEITYSTPCGKFLPILTPIRTEQGDQIIIAIRVQPCGK